MDDQRQGGAGNVGQHELDRRGEQQAEHERDL